MPKSTPAAPARAAEVTKAIILYFTTFTPTLSAAMRLSRIAMMARPERAERTVRVRIKGERGFLTIKGLTSVNGLSRFEWEKEIPVQEAEDLMKLCESGIIDKRRYLVDVGEHTYEVDEFYGENEGLVVAEIELTCEDEAFLKPEWLGQEVTGELKYYNSMLMKNPYKNW